MVIYLHGLWLKGHESLLLRRRLHEHYALDVEVFSYPSVTAPMSEVTARLHAFIDKRAPQELHLLAHSLGGLVAYRFLERFPDQAPGRVVFMGTPAVACHAAVRVARAQWAAAFLGRCVAEELLSPRTRKWACARALGIIAGSRPAGLGRLVTRFTEASDGTVAVSETRLPGATAHITLPVSHTGMLFSARVARAAGEFLTRGHFASVAET